MKRPTRYLLPAEALDQARAERNRAAAALVLMALTIAAALRLIIHFAQP